MSEFVKLTLGERDLTFRALDLDQIEELEPQFLAASRIKGGAVPRETFAAVVEIAAASLKFKHPDITPAECRKLITIGTMVDVLSAVRGVSALESASGEVPAAAA